MSGKVAFIGKMFSGKSAAAEILVKEKKYVRLAFADPVKVVSSQMLQQLNSYLSLYDLPYQEWTYDTIQSRKGEPQVRKLLQLVGTELGRELYGDSVWVDILLKSAENLPKVVVDDCRFENEAAALREDGFKIIRVLRPERLRQQLLEEKYPETYQEILAHPSENALHNFDPDATIFAKDLDGLRTAVLGCIDWYDD